MKVYYVEFDSCKDGVTYSLEQTVEAADIYDAMKIVENYCRDNYSTCEITSVKKLVNGRRLKTISKSILNVNLIVIVL